MTIPPLAFDIRGRDQSGQAFRSARRNMGETRRAANRLNADVKMASASIAGIGKSALIGATGIASFAAAIIKMKQGLEQFDRIAKVARQNGLDGEFYQTLAFMAGEASVDVGVLDNALRKFTVSVGEAKNGAGTLYTELRRIDPTMLDLILNAKTAEERIRLYANAVSNAASAEDKAALVKAGFGQRGADLVRVLELGAVAMDKSGTKAQRLGNIIEQDILDQAEEMQNRLGNAADALDKQLNAALVEASPLLINFNENMAAVVKLSREWASALDELPSKLAAVGNSSVFERLNEMLRAAGLIDESLYSNLQSSAPEDATSYITRSSFGGDRSGDRVLAGFSHFPEVNENRTPVYDASQWSLLHTALESEKRLLDEISTAGAGANDVRRLSADAMGEATGAALDLTKHLSDATSEGRALSNVMNSGLSSIVSDIANGVEALDALKSAGLRVAEQFLQMQIQAAFFGNTVKGIGGGGGGFFSSLLGAVGLRRSGGRAGPGDIMEVGENGRELFVADRAGEIVSNDNLRRVAESAGGASGGNSRLTVELSPELIGALLEEAAGQTVEIVTDNNQRNVGKIANAAVGRSNKLSTNPNFR